MIIASYGNLLSQYIMNVLSKDYKMGSGDYQITLPVISDSVPVRYNKNITAFVPDQIRREFSNS